MVPGEGAMGKVLRCMRKVCVSQSSQTGSLSKCQNRIISAQNKTDVPNCNLKTLIPQLPSG